MSRKLARTLSIGSLAGAAILALAGCAADAGDPANAHNPAQSQAEGSDPSRSPGEGPAETSAAPDSASPTSTATDAAFTPFVDPAGDALQTCATLMGRSLADVQPGGAYEVHVTPSGNHESIVARETFPALGEVVGDGPQLIECKFQYPGLQFTESSLLMGYALIEPGQAERLRTAGASMPGVTVEERDGRSIYTFETDVRHQSPTVISVGEHDVFWSEGPEAWQMAPDL